MTKDIYFAGGCFWGTEHFFHNVTGVRAAVTGYANGGTADPSYEQVYTDTTGFAETVKVTYNPDIVSLESLVDLYFCIIDPLSVNRQGEDAGTRYRTGVYYTDAADLAQIEPVFKKVETSCGAPLAVELKPLENFYPAEEYHQGYLDKNPDGYCHIPRKAFAYLKLYQDIRFFLGDEPETLSRMANISAFIKEQMPHHWVGFYIVKGQMLVLGPFQGPPACFSIPFGKGVCGTAWQRGSTVVVPDVEAFPGHIACSSLTKSEIVVPVISSGEVTAVLDIDSVQPDAFDSTDVLWLEKIAALV